MLRPTVRLVDPRFLEQVAQRLRFRGLTRVLPGQKMAWRNHFAYLETCDAPPVLQPHVRLGERSALLGECAWRAKQLIVECWKTTGRRPRKPRTMSFTAAVACSAWAEGHSQDCWALFLPPLGTLAHRFSSALGICGRRGLFFMPGTNGFSASAIH